MRPIINILLLISALLGFNACSDFLDRYPFSQPATETFYESQEELQMAVNACYVDLQERTRTTPENFRLDMTTDIGWLRDGSILGIQSLGNGEHSASTSFVEALWNSYYTHIARCNVLLENMHKAQAVTDPEVYKRIEGEARFVRAYCYHRLVFLYGDVPLVTVPPKTTDEMYVERISKQEIIDNFLYPEFENAASLLEGFAAEGDDFGRASSHACYAFAARTALYAGNMDKVITYTTKIIDDRKAAGFHKLASSYQDLFLVRGQDAAKEKIWVHEFETGIRTHDIPGQCMPGLTSRTNEGGYSNYMPVQNMVDTYETTNGLMIDEDPAYDPSNPYVNRDPRLDITIVRYGARFGEFNYLSHPDDTYTQNLVTGSWWDNYDGTNPYAAASGCLIRKFMNESDFGTEWTSTHDMIAVRYGEILLEYAEAKIEKNQIDASVLDAINMVRARAYGVDVTATTQYPAITTTNQTDLRRIVRRERKVELAFEGYRLFDIRRWGIAESVIPGKLYGKPLPGTPKFTPAAPQIDDDMKADYSPFADMLRVIEVRKFDPERDYLWPIPQAARDANKKLTQNNKY